MEGDVTPPPCWSSDHRASKGQWTLMPWSILTNPGLSRSTISLRPTSSFEIPSMSASESRKFRTSMFWAMRSLWVDSGMTATPRWMFQRSATWAALFPYLSPMAEALVDRVRGGRGIGA